MIKKLLKSELDHTRSKYDEVVHEFEKKKYLFDGYYEDTFVGARENLHVKLLELKIEILTEMIGEK